MVDERCWAGGDAGAAPPRAPAEPQVLGQLLARARPEPALKAAEALEQLAADEQVGALEQRRAPDDGKRAVEGPERLVGTGPGLPEDEVGRCPERRSRPRATAAKGGNPRRGTRAAARRRAPRPRFARAPDRDHRARRRGRRPRRRARSPPCGRVNRRRPRSPRRIRRTPARSGRPRSLRGSRRRRAPG